MARLVCALEYEKVLKFYSQILFADIKITGMPLVTSNPVPDLSIPGNSSCDVIDMYSFCANIGLLP